MKWILIILEIYAGGCALLMLLAFGVNLLRGEAKFSVEMKMMLCFSIIWPLVAFVPLFWLRDCLTERRENKLVLQLLEKRSQNEPSEVTERFRL
jgi:hypothetical protein